MATERYHRQMILQGFGETAQLKLSAARVLVIGAGGLGCPVLQYLAAAGIGTIGIVDDDTIDLSNLHRQVLYSMDDIGKLKVTVSAQRLQLLNPEISIISHPVRLQQHNILEILPSYDLIFDGTDNFETRYLINDACALLNKPLLFAAVSGYEGQLAIFNLADETGNRTNYRDLFPIAPKNGEVANCAENGVIGVLPGLIGTMAATEIIKLITGIGKPLLNTLLHYNLLNSEQYQLNITPGSDYKLPKTETELLNMNYQTNYTPEVSFIEIDATQLSALQQETSTLIIDVREKHEMPMLNNEIFKQIPMSVFDSFLATEIEEKNVVLICQHGIRSQAAAEALHDKYGNKKSVYSLKGGIVKWHNYFLG